MCECAGQWEKVKAKSTSFEALMRLGGGARMEKKSVPESLLAVESRSGFARCVGCSLRSRMEEIERHWLGTLVISSLRPA